MGVVRATAGTVEAFQNDERANAIWPPTPPASTGLLVSTNAPSRVGDTADPVDAIALLLAEPRYGDTPRIRVPPPRSSACGGPGTASPAASSTTRWCFWLISARLSTTTCSTRPGRAWLRQRAVEAGFELEERAEGVLAVDPEAVATDLQFPAPVGNAYQLALLLIDRLVAPDARGRRTVGTLSPTALRARRRRRAGRSSRMGQGPARGGWSCLLAEEAVNLLVSFGLVRRDEDGTVGWACLPSPATASVSRHSPASPSLFEEYV